VTRYVLLGGAGFLGSHLAAWLLRQTDAEVIVTDVELDHVRALLNAPRFTYYDSDLRHDSALTEHLVASADVVVNLVGSCPEAQAAHPATEVFELELLEGLKIAQLAAREGTRLVQLSSSEVYGPSWLSLVPAPLRTTDLREAVVALSEDSSPLITGPAHRARWLLAGSKHLLERALHAYGTEHHLDFTIVRPFNVVGAGAPVRPVDSPSAPSLPALIAAVVAGDPLDLGRQAAAKRAYVYIDDATEAIGRIVVDESHLTNGETFNIGNPQNEVSGTQLAHLVLGAYRARYWDHRSPLPTIVEDTSAPLDDGLAHSEDDRRVPDITKARVLLGWEPRWELADMIAATMEAHVESLPGRNRDSVPLRLT
jgi:UDP-glucose 4-epimerase